MLKDKIKVKDITIIAVSAALLFSLEQALTFLPNVQLTVFLIVLFSKKLGFTKTTLIVLIHVILDNLVMGSFNIMYFPFMLLGWLVIPLTLTTIFKKASSPITLGFLGILYSFIYSWMFIIPQVLILNIDVVAYLVGDFWWEVVLALSSFLSILWLYTPCSNLLDRIIK